MYLCICIAKKEAYDIDLTTLSPIDYEQHYAQVMYELVEMHIPYWFTNLPFFKQDVLNKIISIYYGVPHRTPYPMLQINPSTKIKIGKVLKTMGSASEHTRNDARYWLIDREVA